MVQTLSSIPTSPNTLPPFFLQRSGHPRALHSFPTRRSSDLRLQQRPTAPITAMSSGGTFSGNGSRCAARIRSEEHTSELQSRFDLVCRLLLEKKKILQHKSSGRHAPIDRRTP